MPRLHTAGEVVMAIEVPVATNLNEPRSTAGATSHIARNRDHSATLLLPDFARGALTGLSGLTIKGMCGRIAIGIEGLVGRLIICPTSTTDDVGQDTLAIGRNNDHAQIIIKVIMIIIWLGVYPLGRGFQIASGPAAIRRIAVVVQRAEDQVVHPFLTPIEAVASSVNNATIETSDGSARADDILTSVIGKKEFPNG